MTFAVYKTAIGLEGFLQCVSNTISALGGTLGAYDSTSRRISASKGTEAISLTVDKEWFQFYLRMGIAHGGPWLFLMLQESSFWEYQLYRGDQCLDQFSTCPEQWGRSAEENSLWRGSAHLLASEWGVEVERVERYLVNWDLGPVWVDILQRDELGYRRGGKAYESDRWPYGCVDQVYDFIRTLGASDFSSRQDVFAKMPPS